MIASVEFVSEVEMEIPGIFYHFAFDAVTKWSGDTPTD